MRWCRGRRVGVEPELLATCSEVGLLRHTVDGWVEVVPHVSLSVPRVVVGCLKITEDKASNTGLILTRGSRFYINGNVALHQQCNAKVAFCAKCDGHAALQYADFRVTFQHKHKSEQTSRFNLNANLWAPRFNVDASLWAPRQSEVRIFAVTGNHQMGQLSPMFSSHNGKLIPIIERFKGSITPQNSL